MDGGPFRMSRSTDRRAATRPEPVRKHQESPQLMEESPRAAAPRTPTQRYVDKDEKTPKRFILPVIIALLIIGLGVVGWFAWSSTQKTVTEIDSSRYQAVFFTNGQVYFGKLQQANGDYLKLTDIYYLQSQGADAKDASSLQETASDQNNVQLIKLGDEIHGPEDKMMISRDQVLFYENLKSDGKVTQSIEKYKNTNE